LIISPLNSANHAFRKTFKLARPALKSGSAREASYIPLKNIRNPAISLWKNIVFLNYNNFFYLKNINNNNINII
jgi:hypothetical protein